MKVLGLILELNPFHHGHAYFISEAIRKVKPDVTIAVLSSNFSMRGEVMVSSKWARAKALLEHQVDIILELPLLATVTSADYFCFNAVKTLSLMNITDLAFGVELDDLNILKKMQAIANLPTYENLLKEYLNKGLSYSGASNKAIFLLSNDEVIRHNFSLPNNTLALGYLKAIDKINPQINVTLIKRLANQYYDKTISDKIYNSATALRELLKNNQDITPYVPKQTNYYNPKQSEAKLFDYLSYLLMTHEASYFTKILGVDEGIENRFLEIVKKARTYDEFISLAQTKRYPINRIKRLIINIVLNISKESTKQNHYYLRLLAFNDNGSKYFKCLPQEIKKQIITSFKNNDNYLVKTELKASKLYSLLVDDKELYLNEFRNPKGEKNEN